MSTPLARHAPLATPAARGAAGARPRARRSVQSAGSPLSTALPSRRGRAALRVTPRRAPAPARAELLSDAQDEDEFATIARRRRELEASTVEALKPVCKSASLTVSGTKAELVDRILRHELGNEMFILYNGGRTGESPPAETPSAAVASSPAAASTEGAAQTAQRTPLEGEPPAADAETDAPSTALERELAEAEAKLEAFEAANADLIDPEAAAREKAAREAASAEAREAARAERARAAEEEAAKIAAMHENAAAEEREFAAREAAEAAAAALDDVAERAKRAADAAVAERAARDLAEADRAQVAELAADAEAEAAAARLADAAAKLAAAEAAAADAAAAEAADAVSNAPSPAAAHEQAQSATQSDPSFVPMSQTGFAASDAAPTPALEDKAAAVAEAEEKARVAAEAEARARAAQAERDAAEAAARAEEAQARAQAAAVEERAQAEAAQQRADAAIAAAQADAMAASGFGPGMTTPPGHAHTPGVGGGAAAAPTDPLEAERQRVAAMRAQADAVRAEAAAAQAAAAQLAAQAATEAPSEPAPLGGPPPMPTSNPMLEASNRYVQEGSDIGTRYAQPGATQRPRGSSLRAQRLAAAGMAPGVAGVADGASTAAGLAAAAAASVDADRFAANASTPETAKAVDPSMLAAAETSADPNDVDARTRRLGANVTSIGCAFGVWAPHAEQMKLLIYGGAPDPLRGIDPNAPLPAPTKYDMARDASDGSVWRLEVQQVGAGWRYAFEVTMPGGHSFVRRDPWAREVDFDSDTCTIVDPRQFNLSDFARPDHDSLIIYQCHVGTFTGRGDPELGTAPGTFVALTRKLDYVKSLGFNAIQLLPHTEFGGAWGYNPRLMHAVHGPYGDPWEFAELVEAAHKRGVSVLVDVALHHGAANGNSLWEFDGWSGEGDGGIYFERAGDTGWGQGFAFWKAEVQEYLAATMDTWLGEYNCDGVRIDSAHSMPPDFVRKVTGRAKERYPDRFVIVEHSPEGPHVPGELGADACWLFSSCEDCAGMTNYWKGNVERLERVCKAPEGYPSNHAFVRFPMGSHDVIGKRPGHTHDLGHWASRFGGRGEWRARASARLWWGAAAGAPGVPMLFMGTEAHQDGHWHTTEDASMDWANIARGGEKWAKEGIACVTAANEVRAKHAALRKGSYKTLHADHENGVLAIERAFDDGNGKRERMLVVINDGDGQWDLEAPYGVHVGQPWEGAGGWEEVFNSQDAAFGGWVGSGNAEGGILAQEGDRLPMAIPKLGVVILKQVEAPSRDPGEVLAELEGRAAASIRALGAD